jgi:hypothetical protein
MLLKEQNRNMACPPFSRTEIEQRTNMFLKEENRKVYGLTCFTLLTILKNRDKI